MAQEQQVKLDIHKKWALAILCLCSGLAPLLARWFPDNFTKIFYGVIVTVFFLVVTTLIRKSSAFRQFWGLSFAFFIFAFIQVLNNTLPGYFVTNILHQTPIAGNPVASTVSGSVIIQLLETFIAVVPILVFTKISGGNLDTIYANRGKLSRWFIFTIISFVIFYILSLRISSHHLFPIHGSMTVNRFLTLTPALLLMVISNGFQEEFLFRGLFLKKYDVFFGKYVSNFLQATIFMIAHIGITYTPLTLIFLILFVFPLGLFAGYLMRKTNGVLAPAIFHAGSDIPIYLAFLTYVT